MYIIGNNLKFLNLTKTCVFKKERASERERDIECKKKRPILVLKNKMNFFWLFFYLLLEEVIK